MMNKYGNFSLNEEVKNGFVVTEKRKKVWQTELDLLEKLDEVCEKYNIKYFADSGTLLGAIRNNGFIPWDDDIDVVMMRKDYDKLIEIGKYEFKDPVFLQNAYTDKNYYRGHAQLRNSNTTAILKHELFEVDFNQGIFIDIFPLDVTSKIKLIERIRQARLKYLKKVMKMKCEKKDKARGIKRKIKNILKIVYKNQEISNIYAKYEKICRNVLFKSNKVDMLSYYGDINKYLYRDKNNYIKPDFIRFENVDIPICKDYDTRLRREYGEEYMIPKNVSSAHGEVIFDTEKNYKEVLELIKKNKYKGGDLNE